MSENLGPLTFGNRSDQVFLGRDIARDRNYSEEVAKAIDAEVRRMIEECYQRAESLLIEHKEKLELVASTLMEKETLEADEFAALMQKAENQD